MASRIYIEKISVKTGEKIMISFLQYFITEICSFSENYPLVPITSYSFFAYAFYLNANLHLNKIFALPFLFLMNFYAKRNK